MSALRSRSTGLAGRPGRDNVGQLRGLVLVVRGALGGLFLEEAEQQDEGHNVEDGKNSLAGKRWCRGVSGWTAWMGWVACHICAQRESEQQQKRHALMSGWGGWERGIEDVLLQATRMARRVVLVDPVCALAVMSLLCELNLSMSCS